MNIAHTSNRAGTGAGLRGSALVRRFALCCVLAAGLSTAGMTAVQAGPGDKDRDERAAQIQRDRYQAQRQNDRDPRDNRAFEQRQEEQRRQLQAQQDQNAQDNAERNRRSGRMTPDERRDLRRQINEAGADLYPKTPRR